MSSTSSHSILHSRYQTFGSHKKTILLILFEMSVDEYKIAVSDSVLEDLQKRLQLTKLPEQLDNDDIWDVGTPLSEVQRLLKYWKDGFNWRKAEALLNEMPQFMTKIEVDGFGELDIHCNSHFEIVLKCMKC